METVSVPKRVRRRLRPLAVFSLGCATLVLLLLVALLVGLFTWRYRLGQRVERGLAKIREAGEPVTPEELTEYCLLPDGVENTAHLWLEATLPLEGEPFKSDARDFPLVGEDESEIPPPGEPWPKREEAEQLLQKYGSSLDQLHRAAEARGAARYSDDFRLGLRMPLVEIDRLRLGAWLLSLHVHVEAHRGNTPDAVASIHAILMMARSLEREPVLVSHLVRTALAGVARKDLQWLLASVELSDEDLVRLQEAFRGLDYREGLYGAMLFERIMLMMAIKDPAVFVGDEVPAAPLWRITRKDSLALSLEHMAEVIAATKRPWPEALQTVEQTEDRLMQIARNGFTRLRYAVPLLLMPGLDGAFEATARHAALNGAADAAIACERYRRRYGALPERLDQLVPEFLPEVPMDPYTGEPLQYVVRDGEYLVYSVGNNGVDEGGLITEDRLEGDHVFRVGRAPEPDVGGEEYTDEEGMADPPD